MIGYVGICTSERVTLESVYSPYRGADAVVTRYEYQQGKLSFMQRERGLDVSQALRTGHVRLKQGIWHNGVITLCQGGTATPDFDARAAGWLAARTRNTSGELGIAWLEAPEGTQLLLVANENFCRWQPNEDDL
ncbi:MAG: DUF1481 domain-containing protein [Sodalis sp. (in: enterobacteria)]|uniref:DUF1481 domain-containing protein n=1 Tax=Sodalis sp. (in: enterobacteria) TaxID=1898979 RepID=UPI0039E410F9